MKSAREPKLLTSVKVTLDESRVEIQNSLDVINERHQAIISDLKKFFHP